MSEEYTQPLHRGSNGDTLGAPTWPDAVPACPRAEPPANPSSPDSPAERAGFEPAVPRWFRSWPGRPGIDLVQRDGVPLPFRGGPTVRIRFSPAVSPCPIPARHLPATGGGTNSSNPLSSSGKSHELALPLRGLHSAACKIILLAGNPRTSQCRGRGTNFSGID